MTAMQRQDDGPKKNASDGDVQPVQIFIKPPGGFETWKHGEQRSAQTIERDCEDSVSTVGVYKRGGGARKGVSRNLNASADDESQRRRIMISLPPNQERQCNPHVQNPRRRTRQRKQDEQHGRQRPTHPQVLLPT